MNYLNIHTDTLRSEAYLGAEPIERATWLNLLAWCVSQENGGVIKGARQWGDRKWLQLCGVTKNEATMTCDLYGFDYENEEDDILVNFYPVEKEAEVKAKRQAGKKGGRPKKIEKTPKPLSPKEEKPHGYDSEKPSSKPSDNHDALKVKTEEKGKERKGKGKENEKEGEGQRNAREESASSPVENVLPHQQLSMQELMTKINSMKTTWSKPATWNHSEQRLLIEGVSDQMQELEDHDWETLRSFLNFNHQNAKAFWTPRNRSKFVETFSDVFESCQRWAEKQGIQPAKATNTNKSWER